MMVLQEQVGWGGERGGERMSDLYYRKTDL